MKFLINKILFTLGLTALAITSVNSYAAHPKVVFVTEPGYEPFEYLDKDGKLTGFDIDLVKEICSKLDLDCTIETADFDALIPGILYKKYDVAIAYFSITEQRQKIISFTDAYLDADSFIWITNANNSITEPSQLKEVAGQTGNSIISYVQNHGFPQIKTYDKFTNIILDLKAKRIDGFIVERAVGEKFLQDPMLKVIGQPVIDPQVSLGVAMVVNKNNNQLRELMNKGIALLKADGTYHKLLAKYQIIK